MLPCPARMREPQAWQPGSDNSSSVLSFQCLLDPQSADSTSVPSLLAFPAKPLLSFPFCLKYCGFPSVLESCFILQALPKTLLLPPVCMCAHSLACVCTCVYMCIYTLHTCMWCMCVHMYASGTCMCAHMCVHKFLCACVCAGAFSYVCVHVKDRG